MLVVHDVSWEDYERLLVDLSSLPGTRIAYAQGRLQAVAPCSDHELYAQVLSDLAQIVADHFGLPLEHLRSTTWKSKTKGRGVEPDACFRSANAHKVWGKVRLDPDTDPPPDVVIEVDLSSDSSSKLPIYASFGVPEIWLYDGRKPRILLLGARGRYIPSPASRAFSLLTAAAMDRLLTVSQTAGQTGARQACRKWIAAVSQDAQP